MTKYSGNLNADTMAARHVDAELQHSMKLFRAQRNFYIAGFALFLFLVLRRLVTLVTALAQMDIQVEATIKQAKSASDAAKSLMGDSKSGGSKSNDSEAITKLKDQLKEKDQELAKAKTNVAALERQSKNLSEEYDRLSAEHKEVLKKTKIAGESKKDS